MLSIDCSTSSSSSSSSSSLSSSSSSSSSSLMHQPPSNKVALGCAVLQGCGGIPYVWPSWISGIASARGVPVQIRHPHTGECADSAARRGRDPGVPLCAGAASAGRAGPSVCEPHCHWHAVISLGHIGHIVTTIQAEMPSLVMLANEALSWQHLGGRKLGSFHSSEQHQHVAYTHPHNNIILVAGRACCSVM